MRAAKGYDRGMQSEAETRPTILMIALIGGAGLLVSLAAFAGWIVQGPEMFLAMAENGLSWCF